MLLLCLHTCYKFSCFLYKCESTSRVTQSVYITIMLSFYVLIGFHKVPKHLLTLLRQELAEE